MTVRDQILDELNAFLRRHSMSPSRLGMLALNDPAFVSRLRKGKHQPNARTIDRVRDFMDAYSSKRETAA